MDTRISLVFRDRGRTKWGEEVLKV